MGGRTLGTVGDAVSTPPPFFSVSCLLNNQQHLTTDTHHIAAVEFNRQNQFYLAERAPWLCARSVDGWYGMNGVVQL